MRRVLVTGGAGFIGSHAAEMFAAAGDGVLVVDDFSTGRAENLAQARSIEVAEADVGDADAMGRILESYRPDVVLHAAASYRDPDAWTTDVRTNVLGTANVVTASARAGVGRLIYLQTALCYGSRPLRLPIPIDHPLLPGSSYAISKVAGESYVRLSGLSFVSFRMTNVYGPRAVAGPLASFARRLMAGQPCVIVDSLRDFVYIDDLLALIRTAADSDVPSGCYHVGTGREAPIAELFALVAAEMRIDPETAGRLVPLPPDDVHSNILDFQATRSAFRWEAKVPLEEGVRRSVEYYRRHGAPKAYSHLRDFGD